MNHTLSAISGGVAGTDQTVREIARLVRYDLERPQLRLMASRLLRNHEIKSKNHIGEARSIYDFVSRRVRYQKDPLDVETVQSPTATIQIGAGDCDDHSGLVAGLAMAVGIPARLRVVGHSEDRLVHIFTELFVDGKWFPADTTEPNHGFGWRPPKFPVERVYNLNGEVRDMSGNESMQVTRGQVKRAIEMAVGQTLSKNWEAGLIDLSDVRGYLRVIREGNFPTKNELAVEPTEKAIQRFADHIVANRIGSLKPAGSSTGLEGLSGFLSSIWNAGKEVVGGMLSQSQTTPGGGESAPLLQISPTITVPENLIQAQATPAVASAFGAGLGSSMVPLLIAAGLALILIVRK